jgi:putative copper export protein
MVALYIAGCWFFGLAWIGTLSALAPAESDLARRIGGALAVAGIAVLVAATTVVVAASNTTALPDGRLTDHAMWAYALGAAAPVLVLGVLTGRGAFARRAVFVLASVPALAYVGLSPIAFRAEGERLGGTALRVHDHHGLVLAAMCLVAALPTVAAVPRHGHDAATLPV